MKNPGAKFIGICKARKYFRYFNMHISIHDFHLQASVNTLIGIKCFQWAIYICWWNMNPSTPTAFESSKTYFSFVNINYLHLICYRKHRKKLCIESSFCADSKFSVGFCYMGTNGLHLNSASSVEIVELRNCF